MMGSEKRTREANHLGRPTIRPSAAEIAAKADGRGCVRVQFYVSRLGDVVVIKEGNSIPSGQELMPQL